MGELLIIVLVWTAVAVWLICSFVLPIIALVRTRRLRGLVKRIEQLEAAVRAVGELQPPGARPAEEPGRPAEPIALRPPETSALPTGGEAAAARPPSPAAQLGPAGVPVPLEERGSIFDRIAPLGDVNWELFIGRRGLGWLAVVVLVFAVAFFLKYAFDNRWIGPLGRVASGTAGGVALTLAGWHYYRRGWRRFSQMPTAAGLILLYLTTYASFGFYHLLPQQAAAAFLLILVVQAAALAVRYDAPAIAFMTLAGGLVTPLLMTAERDQYLALFTYLGVLNAGVVLVAVWRHWRGLGAAALAGTQVLYWLWHFENYHPEKLVAALGFQGVIFGLFLGHSLTAQWLGPRRVGWPELLLVLANPFSYFAAVYVLLRWDFQVWLGTVAIVLAAAYVLLCRLLLVPQWRDNRIVLAALAVVLGFVALAFPIQADAAWVALGWAVEAAALWWFGCRVDAALLRKLAAGLGAVAVARLVIADTPYGWREPFVPIFNEYGLPALLVAACAIGSVIATQRFRDCLGRLDRSIAGVAAIGGLLLVWQILSVETRGYFQALARTTTDTLWWQWIGQMSLSILWGCYATALLGVGLARRLAALRWLALALYAVTLAKVFLIDMATLHAFYRILAFLVLAVLLAVAARAYQRVALVPAEATPSKGEQL